MQTQPQPQPIPPSTLLDDLNPERFLQVEDLTQRWRVTEVTVEIDHLQQEATVPNVRDIDPATDEPRVRWQTVIYFKTKTGDVFQRGYLLSATATDTESLKSATGARTVGELRGRKIKITVAQWRKQPVLRISPVPVTDETQVAPSQPHCETCGQTLPNHAPGCTTGKTQKINADKTALGW